MSKPTPGETTPSPSAGNSSSTDTPSDSLEAQLDHVLELMTQRSGQATSYKQVDHAVTSVLSVMGARPSSQDSSPTKTTERTNPASQNTNQSGAETLCLDTENYDDSDDDDDEPKKGETPPPAGKRRSARVQENDSKRARLQTTNQKKETVKTEETKELSKEKLKAWEDAVGDIPMGRVGAKMMTTFGDGPHPCPETLQAALLGARQCLQVAIRDARAIRRKAREDFDKARKTIARRPGGIAEEVDPELLYRASTTGTDRLARNLKCGFDVEQLTWLYPEEMKAYQKWNEVYSEYERKCAEEADVEDAEQQGGDTETASKHNSADPDNPMGGHLQERAANFDFRTDRMKDARYMKFSRVRTGSFLPRGKDGAGRKSIDRKWAAMRQQGKGRRLEGSWDSLSATSVRFLHWIGFDPPTLYPPEEETTQALGFLGYDILGRIVEKAISLRTINESRAKDMDNDNPLVHVVGELKHGEQLTMHDIAMAMKDADIKPAVMHADAAEGLSVPVQLYFGPGFEQRMELEMEELTQGGPKVSDAEKLIRAEEIEIFSKLSAPPKAVDGLAELVETFQSQPTKTSSNE